MRVAPMMSLMAIFGMLLFNRRGTLLLLLLIAIPLVASQTLCGCSERVEVVISVPKGFAFSEFTFAGDGRVACDDCGADHSTAAPPPTPPLEGASELTNAAMEKTFFDPRVFMGRPLILENDNTPMTIEFRHHGIQEASSMSHYTAVDYLDEWEGSLANGRRRLKGGGGNRPRANPSVDGETMAYLKDGRMATAPAIELSRHSFVSIEAMSTSSSTAKVAAVPSVEAFTISVGPGVTTPSTSGASFVAPTSLILALAALVSFAGVNHRACVALVLLVGATVCLAQVTGDVLIIVDVPDGFCIPEIQGLSGSINCPDCENMVCGAGPGLATAASDQAFLSELLAENSFQTTEVERTCAAGSDKVDVEATEEVTDMLESTLDVSGTFLINGTKFGCVECPEGTFSRGIGKECKACLFPDRCGQGNRCQHGFAGDACSVCPPGLYEIAEDDDHPNGSCDACPDMSFMGYVLLSVGLGGTILSFITMTVGVPAKVKEAEDTKDEAEEFVDMVTATIGYVQALVLLLGFKAWTTPTWWSNIGTAIKQWAYFDFLEIFSGVRRTRHVLCCGIIIIVSDHLNHCSLALCRLQSQ